MPRKVKDPALCRSCTKPRHEYTTKGGKVKLSPFCKEHMEKEREYKRAQRLSVARYVQSPSYEAESAKAAAETKEQ